MKTFKSSILLGLLALVSLNLAAQEVSVPLGGNVYSANKSERRGSITNNGIERWTNPSDIFTVYFRVGQPGTLAVALGEVKTEGKATLEFTVNKSSKTVDLEADNASNKKVGEWKIKDTGYVAIQIKGLSKNGNEFPAIKNLLLSGTATVGNVVYVKGNEDGLFHFGRRGPSTHLNYEQPKGVDAEWFYNEVTIPVGEDKMGSYFMANGFGEGYFGMQVNSPTERHILFSVWSPFTTDNPKEIPESHKIRLIKKGEGVHGGEFGGEGSGGQSYLNYLWKAGNTYKFLLRVRPVADNYSEYTAYFFAPELNKWQLIACFQRPQTQTYAKRLYSFLENFSPNMGDVARTGTYGNQWVCDTQGNWIEIDKAMFSIDATGRKNYRKDYQGGIHPNGNFYLKIDGFFNDFTPYKTMLTRKKTNRKPEIDFSKLP